jgi:hypothetical protein
MSLVSELQDRVLNANAKEFEVLAMEIFQYQSQNNSVYATYLKLLGKSNFKPDKLTEIPFLPIELFKTKIIQTGNWEAQRIFESSGTTQQQKSRHLIQSIHWYDSIARKCFEQQYGSIKQYEFFGLLPEPEENPASSLVCMFQFLINASESTNGTHYFISKPNELFDLLNQKKAPEKKLVLFGLSLALFDFAKEYTISNDNLIVIETGGMKNSEEKSVKQI